VEEADYLCDRIAIMNQGRIALIDTPEGLKDSIGDSSLSIRLSQGSTTEMAKLLSEIAWIRNVNQHDGWLELSISSKGTRIPEVVRLARSCGFIISSISQHKPSLEDVFLHYAGRVLEKKEHE